MMPPSSSAPTSGITSFPCPIDHSTCREGCLCEACFVPLVKQAIARLRYSGSDSDETAVAKIKDLKGRILKIWAQFRNTLLQQGDEFYQRFIEHTGEDIAKWLATIWPKEGHCARFPHLIILLSESPWDAKLKGFKQAALPFLRPIYFADGKGQEDRASVSERLLSLMVNRAKHTPQDFAVRDIEQGELEWKTGILPKRYNAKCVNLSGKDYGTLQAYDRDEVHGGISVGYARFLQHLQRQLPFYEMLHSALIKALATKTDIARWKNPLEPNAWHDRAKLPFPAPTETILPFSLIERSYGPPTPKYATLTGWKRCLVKRQTRGLRSLSDLQTDPLHARKRICEVLPDVAQSLPKTMIWQTVAVLMWKPEQERVSVIGKVVAILKETCEALRTDHTGVTWPMIKDRLTLLRESIDNCMAALCRGHNSVLAKTMHAIYGDALLSPDRTNPSNGSSWNILFRHEVSSDALLCLLAYLAIGEGDEFGWATPELILTIRTEGLARVARCRLPSIIVDILGDIATMCALKADLRDYGLTMAEAEIARSKTSASIGEELNTPVTEGALGREQISPRRLLLQPRWNGTPVMLSRLASC